MLKLDGYVLDLTLIKVAGVVDVDLLEYLYRLISTIGSGGDGVSYRSISSLVEPLWRYGTVSFVTDIDEAKPKIARGKCDEVKTT